MTLKPWANRGKGKILTRGPYLYIKNELFYRERNGLVTEICLGERYAHIAPGIVFMNEKYKGSYIDNWHGGPSGSLSDMVEWIAEAEHPEYGYSLWMEKEEKSRPEGIPENSDQHGDDRWTWTYDGSLWTYQIYDDGTTALFKYPSASIPTSINEM